MRAMKTIVGSLMVLLITTGLAGAGEQAWRDPRPCRAEVLQSEELPAAPIFHHAIRATLLVTGSDARQYQTTIYEVIPWQVPPLRRGQLVRVPCDRDAITASFPFF